MTAKSLFPLLLFGVIAIALYVGLGLNPREIPSVLIDKQVPEFTLPAVKGGELGFASADLKAGEPTMVNVFASWCVPCRAEHPFLMALADEGAIAIYGLNYKDKPDQARRFLDELGDPYERTGDDRNGRVGIDWGVYGVPETFIVDGQGRIRLKHIGPITTRTMEEQIRPLIEQLRDGS